jgi:hypothetical protein
VTNSRRETRESPVEPCEGEVVGPSGPVLSLI